MSRLPAPKTRRQAGGQRASDAATKPLNDLPELVGETAGIELASVRSDVVTMISVSDMVVEGRLSDGARMLKERVGIMIDGIWDLLA